MKEWKKKPASTRAKWEICQLRRRLEFRLNGYYWDAEEDDQVELRCIPAQRFRGYTQYVLHTIYGQIWGIGISVIRSSWPQTVKGAIVLHTKSALSKYEAQTYCMHLRNTCMLGAFKRSSKGQHPNRRVSLSKRISKRKVGSDSRAMVRVREARAHFGG